MGFMLCLGYVSAKITISSHSTIECGAIDQVSRCFVYSSFQEKQIEFIRAGMVVNVVPTKSYWAIVVQLQVKFDKSAAIL